MNPRTPETQDPMDGGKAAQAPAERLPYDKPRVEPAGSVFERTGALNAGTKDGIMGSILL